MAALGPPPNGINKLFDPWDSKTRSSHMRENVKAFVEIAAAAFQASGPVYEFGALRVAGQSDLANLRQFFPGKNYVGCDLRPGEGVDRVEDLADLSLPDGCARTIICVDTLEHVFEARRAVDEMIRVLAPGGLMLLAAPMDFRVHDYPSDYWRLTPSCMSRLLAPLEATVIGWQGVENHPHTVFGIAVKAPAPSGFLRGTNRFIEGFQASLAHTTAQRGWPERLKSLATRWTRGKGEWRRRRDHHSSHFVLNLPAINRQSAGNMLLEMASDATGQRLDIS